VRKPLQINESTFQTAEDGLVLLVGGTETKADLATLTEKQHHYLVNDSLWGRRLTGNRA
jgi:hypothetical protein